MPVYGLLLAAFLTIAASPALSAPDETPATTERMVNREAFARDFAQKVLAMLQDQKKSYADRKTLLRQAFSHSVDIDWIARFVIGRAWNNATEEQKAQYTELYRTYLTESYVRNFAENPDKRIRDIKVFNVSENNDADFTVRTEMMLANFDNLKVNYLVRDYGGRYKILDIAIENVSLITTHRQEFGALASAEGIDGVIAQLKTVTEDRQFAMVSSEATVSRPFLRQP